MVENKAKKRHGVISGPESDEKDKGVIFIYHDMGMSA